jgi:two-component system chemotaxis response regulator CheY
MVLPQILCVDDSLTVRSQVRAALEPHGMKVVEGANGVEGLWQARQRRFDLVVVDVHMPIMGGLQMVRDLRQLAGYARTPVFILTSDSADTRIEEGRRVGANAWILKPFKPDLLWKAVEKAITGGPMGTLPASGIGSR